MKLTALALMLIVAPTDVMAGPFCKDSPMQFWCAPTLSPCLFSVFTTHKFFSFVPLILEAY